MARYFEPTPTQEADYAEWCIQRPEKVRVVAEQFEPWSLFKMKATGQRVVVTSFGETKDGNISLTVLVSGRFNLTQFEREVFGISPDELEPCELPSPDEPVGAAMSGEEVAMNIDNIRLTMRPDLWEVGPD